MATVHPSRLGLVPGARQDRSRASAPVSAPSAPPSAAPSREEELRRQLLQRRRERGDEEDNAAERSSRDERGSRGGDRDRDGSPGRRSGERERRTGQVSSKWDERPDDRSASRQSPARDARSPGRRGYDDPPHVRRVDDNYHDRRDRRPSPSYRPAPLPPSREEAFISLDAGAGGHSTGTSDISKYGYGRERNDIPHGGAPPPWRFQGGGGPAGPPNRMGFSGQLDYERRRVERQESTLSIWPPSPKEPYKDEDELRAERKAARKAKRSAKSRKSKRRSRRYSDESESSELDSEEDDRRKRSRKDKARRRRYDDETPSEGDSEEEERRRRRRREREKRSKRYSAEEESDDERRERRKSKSRDADREEVADQWVEKGGEVVFVPRKEAAGLAGLPADDEDEDEVGPRLPNEPHYKERRDKALYDHMLPGEGAAMAAYAASGERIPRRGEIGLDASQIDAFEQAGYVMSGNRHKRMTAVRLRKENQVINAEEKRAILNLQREERIKKEGAIISQFKEMMDDSLRKQGLDRP